MCREERNWEIFWAAGMIERKRSKGKQQEKMDRVRKELGLERVTDALKGGGGGGIDIVYLEGRDR